MSADRAAAPGLFRYGVEAPYVPIGMLAGVAVAVVLSVVTSSPWWLIAAVILFVQASLFLHTTLRGKNKVLERELDKLAFRGNERLLDLGCGRGAVLIPAAQRLPHGTAEGVDLWRSKDQTGNTIEVARANAAAAGVADRIVLHTADMTDLPFEDATFDLVTSALAVHNIPDADGRRRAIEEAVRVLKPGGRLAIIDFQHVDDYVGYLGSSMAEVETRPLGINYWYGGPWTAGSILAARKT